MTPPTFVRIDEWEMRCKFNRGRYWQRALNNELKQVVKDKHPAAPKAGQPVCTKSQEVSYIDANGFEVARVHQYVLKDGRLGASGKPDPKRLVENGVLYRLLNKEEIAARDAKAILPKKIRQRWMQFWAPIRCRWLGY